MKNNQFTIPDYFENSSYGNDISDSVEYHINDVMIIRVVIQDEDSNLWEEEDGRFIFCIKDDEDHYYFDQVYNDWNNVIDLLNRVKIDIKNHLNEVLKEAEKDLNFAINDNDIDKKWKIKEIAYYSNRINYLMELIENA